MGKRKDLTYWNIPVPKALDEAVEKAVETDLHITKSDLVRDAVRRLLEELENVGRKRLGVSSYDEANTSSEMVKSG